MFFAPLKSSYRAESLTNYVPKTSDHNQIKVKMTNPSQEHQASSKASYPDYKDMDALYTFKIKIENQNLEHGWTKDN